MICLQINFQWSKNVPKFLKNVWPHHEDFCSFLIRLPLFIFQVIYSPAHFLEQFTREQKERQDLKSLPTTAQKKITTTAHEDDVIAVHGRKNLCIL